MRFAFSCNEEYCKNLEDFLKAYGLKSVFLKNILQKMVDDSGFISKERIKAVIMNDFSISFDDNSNSNPNPSTEPTSKQDKVDDNRLGKIKKSFAERL